MNKFSHKMNFDGTKEVNRECLEQANQIIEDGIDAQKLYLLSSTA
ncbi:hypothetical protein CC1_03800 [Coprococcus catus GD/7]|uniref:Uncharacterized protein n=1 Tax=Coprococcus catus GD/7 TaxID=717962 RepID=D4J4P2_9FIRM|nr:hypothetical protein [Coprococcus catus]CBK79313.1 hypothetical protein CC1_03800 [Coprococcus catus GD/7]